MADERTGIKIDIFSDWNGATVSRGVGIVGTVKVEKDEDFDAVLDKVKASVSENTVVEPNLQKRSIQVKQAFRLDAEIPIPTTDEEAKELYGLTIEELIAESIHKISYDRDTNVGNKITDAILAGQDFGELEDASAYAAEFEEELRKPKTKSVSKAKVNKKKADQMDALQNEFGMTPEQIMEFMRNNLK